MKSTALGETEACGERAIPKITAEGQHLAARFFLVFGWDDNNKCKPRTTVAIWY